MYITERKEQITNVSIKESEVNKPSIEEKKKKMPPLETKKDRFSRRRLRSRNANKEGKVSKKVEEKNNAAVEITEMLGSGFFVCSSLSVVWVAGFPAHQACVESGEIKLQRDDSIAKKGWKKRVAAHRQFFFHGARSRHNATAQIESQRVKEKEMSVLYIWMR